MSKSGTKNTDRTNIRNIEKINCINTVATDKNDNNDTTKESGRGYVFRGNFSRKNYSRENGSREGFAKRAKMTMLTAVLALALIPATGFAAGPAYPGILSGQANAVSASGNNNDFAEITECARIIDSSYSDLDMMVTAMIEADAAQQEQERLEALKKADMEDMPDVRGMKEKTALKKLDGFEVKVTHKKMKYSQLIKKSDTAFFGKVAEQNIIGENASDEETTEIAKSAEQNINEEDALVTETAEIETVAAKKIDEEGTSDADQADFVEAAENQDKEAAEQAEETKEYQIELVIPVPDKTDKLSKEMVALGDRLAWPLPDSHVITSHFGHRASPGGIGSTYHQGLDISAPYGTPIIAAKDGIVERAAPSGARGNCVIIDHGNGYETLYGHMSKMTCNEGDKVKAGDVIGKVGSTGASTGPHLHFSVIKNDIFVDPEPYLTGQYRLDAGKEVSENKGSSASFSTSADEYDSSDKAKADSEKKDQDNVKNADKDASSDKKMTEEEKDKKDQKSDSKKNKDKKSKDKKNSKDSQESSSSKTNSGSSDDKSGNNESSNAGSGNGQSDTSSQTSGDSANTSSGDDGKDKADKDKEEKPKKDKEDEDKTDQELEEDETEEEIILETSMDEQ